MKNSLMIFIIVAFLIVGGIFLYTKKQNNQPSEQRQRNIISETPSGNTSPTGISKVKETLSLTVFSPVDNSTVTNSTVMVKGKTIANADVSVNDDDLKADNQGNFSISVNLEDGDNLITVVVSDDAGNSAEKELTIIYDSGQQTE
ncbi:hypothetical protein HY041_00275 [Candidatus Roizmanbacteria bacterium]|nr:hypothetical protein [Candidatus Roizmanbacteria bacterium]